MRVYFIITVKATQLLMSARLLVCIYMGIYSVRSRGYINNIIWFNTLNTGVTILCTFCQNDGTLYNIIPTVYDLPIPIIFKI